MVNEEKVKLMTKMAIYESKEGETDLKISHFHINEYIKMEVIKAIIVDTLTYAIILGMLLMLFVDNVIEKIQNQEFQKYLFMIVLGYIVFVMFDSIYARDRAKQRYLEARPRMRAYKKNLAKLHFMYELEEEKNTNPKKEELKEKIEEELDGENRENIEF